MTVNTDTRCDVCGTDGRRVTVTPIAELSNLTRSIAQWIRSVCPSCARRLTDRRAAA